jgi:hypothetical protein
MPGIEGERAASGSFSEAESDPSMGGLTERANGSEACDNQTEWEQGRQARGRTKRTCSRLPIINVIIASVFAVFRRLKTPKMPGIEGEHAASGSFSEAESDPSMGGLTERANGSEACDNQTEWAQGWQASERTKRT